MEVPNAVLFDLDGTLTDSFLGITNCLRYALARMGRPVSEDEDLNWCVGPPIHRSFAKLVGEENADEGVRLYRERFGEIGWRENQVYEGIHDTLDALSTLHIPLIVATSKAQHYVPRILSHFGLDHYFSAAYGSEMDGTRDNKAVLIEHVLKAEELCPTTAVMVGDRKYDVIGANENGVRCVGALWGYGSPEELSEAGAWRLCDRPINLLELLSVPEPSVAS